MIGLDANVLVRYITQDDKEQAAIADRIINKYTKPPYAILINDVVMCELIWVLEKAYKYKKEQIVMVIKQILITKEFVFEKYNVLWFALDQYIHNELDFSDALIAQKNKYLGCKATFTFDKAALKAEGFESAK